MPHVSRFSRRGKSPKVAERAMKFNRYLRLSSLMRAALVARADATRYLPSSSTAWIPGRNAR